jgi:NADPH:quinone reductase-like Zn-dependent oxidoreductase
MKAVIINQYGGRDQMKYTDIPMPTIGDRDVLIEVHAAGVNPADWKFREGYMKIHEFPLILGWDVSGVIAEVGKDVTGFKIGDEVFSNTENHRNGSYAEYVAVNESEVALKPKNITFEEASIIPMAALTAWDALVNVAGIKQGDRVLIHGGAGGIGGYAIQIAKIFNCFTVTTVTGKQIEYVKSLGANEVVDFLKEDFSKIVADVDIVLDVIGGDIQLKSCEVLKENGVLVSTISMPDPVISKQKRVQGKLVWQDLSGKDLERIAALIEEGKIKPAHITKTLPLKQAVIAHELIESGQATGKIVLKVK